MWDGQNPVQNFAFDIVRQFQIYFTNGKLGKRFQIPEEGKSVLL